MHQAEIDYSKINKYIYLGSNSCCEIHFDKKLLDFGVTANIGLEAEKIDQPRGVEYSLWLPTVDHEAPSQKQLKAGVAFMSELIANKVKMYVHCKYGHGRSPVLVMAYLIAEGMTPQVAHDYIKSKRPEIHLTSNQSKALIKFAKSSD